MRDKRANYGVCKANCNVPKEYYYYLLNKFHNKIDTEYNIKPFPKKKMRENLKRYTM